MTEDRLVTGRRSLIEILANLHRLVVAAPFVGKFARETLKNETISHLFLVFILKVTTITRTAHEFYQNCGFSTSPARPGEKLPSARFTHPTDLWQTKNHPNS